jgi:putative CocE/NonD family hydrolase
MQDAAKLDSTAEVYLVPEALRAVFCGAQRPASVILLPIMLTRRLILKRGQMRIMRRTFACVAVLSFAFSPVKWSGAQGGQPFTHWDESKLSQPTYKAVVDENVQIAMRDGVKLVADVYRPDAPGQFPALVLRTPYSKRGMGEERDSKWFAERGYVVVNQDVRGRYMSAGEFYAYRNEPNDGYDTDEWVARQPWSNGKVGTLGGSYLGYTQLTQAIRSGNRVVSMATDVTSTDIYHGWTYVDGAFHLGFTLEWGAGTIYKSRGQNGKVDYLHLPVMTADQVLGNVNLHYRDWLMHPRRNDPYWDNISFERQARKIAAPLLVATGWFDIFLRGALQDDVNIRKNGATELARKNKHIVIGPWTHFKTHGTRTGGGIDFGPEAELNGLKLYLAWHDRFLKGIDNGVDRKPPLTLFIMGENKWRYENEWPLARTKYTRYYISSNGKANGAKGDGKLGAQPPAGVETDQYLYDPASPVPTLGGNVCCTSVPLGMHDHQPIEARDDVLVYTTPALMESVEVTGPITMRLYAATSAKDTDWIARLADVYPDGRVYNLQDGILRARYRSGKDKPASLLQPGKVYRYDIDMWATSNVFLPGHRIRLEITSSNFPRFDRNLNTGEDPATGTRMEKAQQTIYHSGKYPSHVVLPIIPSGQTVPRTGK